jgi:Na+-transporting NADH:ubiquinone oxidoreductase subunit NqrE
MPCKSTVSIVGVLAEIQTRHPLNTSQKHYNFGQLVQQNFMEMVGCVSLDIIHYLCRKIFISSGSTVLSPITSTATLYFHTAYLDLLQTYVKQVHNVTKILQCLISTFGRKLYNALFWFSSLCCTISAYFHARFTLLQRITFLNVFCSKSHLNCRWLHTFDPSFPKIHVDG